MKDSLHSDERGHHLEKIAESCRTGCSSRNWLFKSTFIVITIICLGSCFNPRDQHVTGTVRYFAESSTFTSADKVVYKDKDGKYVSLNNIPLPFEYSYYLNDKNTYDLDPAEFTITISVSQNSSGGEVHTTCSFSQNLKNSDDRKSYASNVEINQNSWCRIYPNTF